MKRKREEKQTVNVAKGVAAATAVGLTAGVLLKRKNGLNNGQSKIEQLKESVSEQTEEIKSKMLQEIQEKVRGVKSSAVDASVAKEEIYAAYKRAKHEVKQLVKDAHQQFEELH